MQKLQAGWFTPTEARSSPALPTSTSLTSPSSLSTVAWRSSMWTTGNHIFWTQPWILKQFDFLVLSQRSLSNLSQNLQAGPRVEVSPASNRLLLGVDSPRLQPLQPLQLRLLWTWSAKTCGRWRERRRVGVWWFYKIYHLASNLSIFHNEEEKVCLHVRQCFDDWWGLKSLESAEWPMVIDHIQEQVCLHGRSTASGQPRSNWTGEFSTTNRNIKMKFVSATS